MKLWARCAAALLPLLLTACPGPVNGPRDTKQSSEIPPPAPPARVDSDNEKACAGLARAGCREASPPKGQLSCVDAFAQAEAERANIRYQCFADVKTAEDVRACGGPGYYTVRCRQ